MSTITEKTKNGKVVAFKFLAHVGRDEKGKQHFRTTTWKPPAGMSYAKARKMAEAEAYKWEQELLSMAKRVTPEEIVEMHRLYAKYGNFAAVGRELGRSGSTVAKYIRMKGTPDIVKHTFKEVVRGA